MGAGKRLKELIAENNISIKELSKKTDISLNTLYSITKRDPQRIYNTELCEKIGFALNKSSYEVEAILNGNYQCCMERMDSIRKKLYTIYDLIDEVFDLLEQ